MAEKTYNEKYAELDKICNDKIAILEPFLKKMSQQHDAGTGFYEDITVLSGPSFEEYNHFVENRRDTYDRWKRGEVSIFNIKFAGVVFVIEYQNATDPRGILQRRVPSNAFMVYKHRTYPVSLNIATAVQDLYHAQEYRGILWGCIRDQHGRWGK